MNVPTCTHDLPERESACADGYCPLCAATEVADACMTDCPICQRAKIERLTAERNALISAATDTVSLMMAADARWRLASAENERLRAAIVGLRWKSVDRDNMEFECRVTCYEKDKLDALVQQLTPQKE
jgi:erythromycin esterase-like protein